MSLHVKIVETNILERKKGEVWQQELTKKVKKTGKLFTFGEGGD